MKWDRWLTSGETHPLVATTDNECVAEIIWLYNENPPKNKKKNKHLEFVCIPTTKCPCILEAPNKYDTAHPTLLRFAVLHRRESFVMAGPHKAPTRRLWSNRNLWALGRT